MPTLTLIGNIGGGPGGASSVDDLDDIGTVGAVVAKADTQSAARAAIAAPSTTDLAAKANDADVLKTTGAQSVGGVKTFTSIPVLPGDDPTAANQAARKAYVDAQAAAATAAVPTASTTTPGKVELATNTETFNGLDAGRVPPVTALVSLLIALGFEMKIKATSASAFPTRASKVPTWWTGDVIWDMSAFPTTDRAAGGAAADAAGAIDTDWLDVFEG